ncbi:Cmc2 protein [Saccharomycopsis crataegensis]|uniref:COX assembly mitochondrial protein n=1 Tax=Saccharomycopsis crataegensis TaxID=43959 RepID=A0AAV5QTN7_9ASCO|nr:Cmc2 protein [Saccharomycopsis crataegensis]
MHPLLEGDRFSDCEYYIQALNECHKAEFVKKAFGLCNVPKDNLSKCLHETRIAQSIADLQERRNKRKVTEEKWKKMKEEEYGKDMKLKKVIEEEMKRRAQQ